MRKRAIGLIASILVLSMLLVACGGKKTSSKERDTLVIALPSDAVTLDPQQDNEIPSQMMIRQMFEGLVTLDDDLEVQGALASKFEVLDDDITYMFEIHKGIKFHNGEELKADDVAFSIGRAMKSPAIAHIYDEVDTVEALDDYSVKLVLKQPYAPFMAALAHPSGFIVNRKAVEEAGDQVNQKPVGTGPYKLVDWQKANEINFERFEDYHGNKPQFAKLKARAIPEPTNRVVELESGGVDIALDVSPNDISRVEANSDLKIERTFNMETQYLGLNQKSEILKNDKVREAIRIAIDMSAIEKAVWLGVGKEAKGPYASTLAYSLQGKLDFPARDVEKAKALLAEAGYPDGLELTLSTNERKERVDMATIIQAQLAEIGIKLKLDVMEWGTYYSLLQSGSTDMFQIGWTPDAPDPDQATYAIMHSKMQGEGNFMFLNNPELDAMLEKARITEDGPEREKLYEDAQLLVHNMNVMIYEHNGEYVFGMKKEINGVVPVVYGIHPFYNATIAN